MVIYKRRCFLTKEKKNTYWKKYSNKCGEDKKIKQEDKKIEDVIENKAENKSMIITLFMWQNVVTFFQRESSLANYIMDYLLGKNHHKGKLVCMPE